MIKTSELKKGIEYCLENGKRLFDDASFLHKNKRYASAIPLYVLAYEEMNKALFLDEKFYRNENISDKEYNDFFTKGSHAMKLKVDYQIKKDALEKMTDKEFNEIRMDIESKGRELWWHIDRKSAIKNIENALLDLEKFNRLKKQFLYVDYADGKWLAIQNRFRNKSLDALCEFLYYVTIETYLKVKLHLDMYKMGYIQNMPEPNSSDERSLSQNQYLVESERLRRMFRTAKFRNIHNLANKLLESL